MTGEQSLVEKPNYKPIYFFLNRHKLLFLGILLVTLLSSILESFSAAAFFPLFTAALGDSSQETGGILGFFNTLVGIVPFAHPIAAASALLVVVFLMKTVVNFALDLLMGYTGGTVLYNTKKDMMDRYSAAHYQYFLDNQQGDLIYNVLSTPTAAYGVLLSGVQALSALFRGSAIVAILISISAIGFVAVVIVSAVYYGFMHYVSNKVSYSLGQKNTYASAEQTSIVNDFFSGFRQIISLNGAKSWTQRFDRSSRISRNVHVQIAAWNAFPRPLTQLCALGLMLGIILTIALTGSGNLTEELPKLGVFAVALYQLLPALSGIGVARMSFMSSLPDMTRAYQTIAGPVPLRQHGSTVLESFDKEIAFENVTFAYKDREPVLKNLNLTFKKGQVTAIVGISGAGKTTITNLILGLIQPIEGRITVDGISLDEITAESWLGKIGSVSQDTFIYHSSITDNILLGRNGHSESDIIAATTLAHAHGYISEHPEGYDAIVGDRGMRLSGGQQQRLSIARAVLDNPEILIFDEATSSLDTISEDQVQEAIGSVSRNRTAILIAHRLSTVEHADKIIVLDDGRVIEQGNHQELLDQNGQYSRLAASRQ